jgi:CRISPR/Cas system-associated endoribonuclease Cas2
MKRVYIVTYDLSNPGKNYESLLKRIKAYDAWARLGGSSYLVLTELNATQLRDNLTKSLDSNDSLYVGLMDNSAAWRGLGEKVSIWIKNNQK